MTKETEQTLYFFHEGTNYRAWEYYGAHRDAEATVFRVWAPRAESVFVVGDFNGWQETHPMRRVPDGESWEVSVADAIEAGAYYKYKIYHHGTAVYKADPFARCSEHPSGTASRIEAGEPFFWQDEPWLSRRVQMDFHRQPINIYEMHFASWRRRNDAYPGFREIAEELRDYLSDMGYTHVEIMPVTEYPFDGSWGYQTMGYYAPSARFGTPDDFRYLIDTLHQAGIGVIFDFVIAHFPKDDAGLVDFDGAPLYEYSDELKRENKSWGTRCFDAGRKEVRSFLISSVMYWIEEFHIDGIRFDAVSSMLYLDYDRAPGEWRPNCYGDNRNLEAVDFIKHMNSVIKQYHPDVLLTAEESSSWGGVTRPVSVDGLGFDFKWNMGWINDLQEYVGKDPVYRKYYHDRLTFPMLYAYTEHFILPLSHDEVVHGKGSLIEKMFGNETQKCANVRSFLLYMMTFPGKKLLFMGSEFGQHAEWNYNAQLEWYLTEEPDHARLHDFVRALNHLYREEAALWQDDDSWDGFSWLSCDDADRNVLAYCRSAGKRHIFAVISFSGQGLHGYRVPSPVRGGAVCCCLASGEARFSGNNTGDCAFLRRERRRNGASFFRVSLSEAGGILFRVGSRRYTFRKGV